MEKIGEILKKDKPNWYIPPEERMTYEELLRCNIEDFNKQTGNLNLGDGYNCTKCKNRGYWQRLNKDTIIETYECTCKPHRRAIRDSGLNNVTKGKKEMTDYKADSEWQKASKRKAEKYIKQNSGYWFIACGQSGSGKTLICSIIANDLLFDKHKAVRCVCWQDFIGKLKRDLMNDNVLSADKSLNDIKQCEILFLDEVLKAYNDTDLRYLAEIINYRYTNDLVTILTSEHTITDLLAIDETTFGRVLEKCGDYVISIAKDKNRNYRTRGLKNGQ